MRIPRGATLCIDRPFNEAHFNTGCPDNAKNGTSAERAFLPMPSGLMRGKFEIRNPKSEIAARADGRHS